MDPWTLLVLHAAATYSLLGLIWVVQLVHYPSFLRVDREHFAAFAKFHVDRISVIVVPLMFLELLTGVGLCLLPIANTGRSCFVIGLGLIGLIWTVTAFTSVPLHRRLLTGFDERSIRLLVGWNWIRTICWTVRALGLTWVLWSLG